MSKDDLIWNAAQAAVAAAEGWRVVYTIDNGETTGGYDIACMVDGDQLRSTDQRAAEFVVANARNAGGGALHRYALSLVMRSR